MGYGILASCYSGFPHDMVHLTIKPMQKFGEVMGWILGDDWVSSLFWRCKAVGQIDTTRWTILELLI